MEITLFLFVDWPLHFAIVKLKLADKIKSSKSAPEELLP